MERLNKHLLLGRCHNNDVCKWVEGKNGNLSVFFICHQHNEEKLDSLKPILGRDKRGEAWRFKNICEVMEWVTKDSLPPFKIYIYKYCCIWIMFTPVLTCITRLSCPQRLHETFTGLKTKIKRKNTNKCQRYNKI